jgi:4-hydroxy-4-methyl-2-oxoglutarate aldolase
MRCAIGGVETIVAEAIRDADEMTIAGFKALARCLCVGHAHVHPVRWNCEVEVFGRIVRPGDLIHADKHGFLVSEPEAQPHILEAARLMDADECQTVIPAARSCTGPGTKHIPADLPAAGAEFVKTAKGPFQRDSEW